MREHRNNLLRVPIAVSRVRLLLAYQLDMWLRHNVRYAHMSLHRNSQSSFSRRSLCGSLHSGMLATVLHGFWNASVRKYGPVYLLTAGIMMAAAINAHAGDNMIDPTRPPAESLVPGSPMIQTGPVLQSVKISPARRSAIVSGQEVEVGSRFGDQKVVKITEGEVVLRGSEGTQTLKLFPDVEKRNRPVAGMKPSDKAHPKKKRRGK